MTQVSLGEQMAAQGEFPSTSVGNNEVDNP